MAKKFVPFGRGPKDKESKDDKESPKKPGKKKPAWYKKSPQG